MTKLYSPTYRPDIDGLRGFCLIILVVAHAFPNIIPGAYLAVDVFFVISGYLMTMIISRSYEKGSFSFIEFYSRRMRRILPAFLFALTVILTIGYLTFFPDEFQTLMNHTMASAFMYANWQFIQDQAHYFTQSAKYLPLIHVWSLAIEEQFYAAIPIYLWIALRLRIKLIIPLILIFLLSLYVFFSIRGNNGMFTYWATPPRIWELAAGGILFLMKSSSKRNEAASIAGFLLLISGLAFFSDWHAIHGKILAVSGSVLLIGPGANSSINRVVFSNRFLVSIGLASFSIYLWHWPLMALTRILNGSPLGNIGLITIVILSFVAGGLSWKFIELPTRRRSLVWPWFTGTIVLGGLCWLGLESGFEGRLQIPSPKFESKTRACHDDPEIKKLGNVQCDKPLHGSTKILMVGDSHIQDKLLGLSSRDPGRWGYLGKSGCAPITGYRDSKTPECPELMNNVLEYAVTRPEIEALILGFNQNFHVLNRLVSDKNPGKTQNEYFLSGIRETIRRLVSSGKKVVVLMGVPVFPLYPMDCYRNPHACTLPEKEVPVDELVDDFRKMVNEEFPEVEVFDPYSIFCKEGICSFMKDGIVMYRDFRHLDPKGSEVYAEEFLKKIKL